MKSEAIGDEYSGVYFRHGIMYGYQLVNVTPVKKQKPIKEYDFSKIHEKTS